MVLLATLDVVLLLRVVPAAHVHAPEDPRTFSNARLADELRSTMALVEDRRVLLSAAITRLTLLVGITRMRSGAD